MTVLPPINLRQALLVEGIDVLDKHKYISLLEQSTRSFVAQLREDGEATKDDDSRVKKGISFRNEGNYGGDGSYYIVPYERTG
ncbi:hypothetical protein AAF712_016595 [Marasmius tenuissimus]|uniref:Uncharacterized protein n=1 Tax=Marasmius tenuissimus TaxID=585030 RepID=A0ABR2Z7M0_9AGAR